jgi:hypothetical protein
MEMLSLTSLNRLPVDLFARGPPARFLNFLRRVGDKLGSVISSRCADKVNVCLAVGVSRVRSTN